MEIIDFVALTIVALVIFMFVYRFYFKKQHRTISSVNNKAVSANSVSCVPENGASKTHECLATYSMDIKIEDYLGSTNNKHIFSVCAKPVTQIKCAFNNQAQLTALLKNRLTLTLDKTTNNLIITSEYLDSPETIENIPLQEWVNISVVFDTDRMEVYINGKLSNTSLLNKPVLSNNLNIYTTQLGGFDGYIRNVQYIPDSLSTREINSLIGQSSGGAGSFYDTMNSALNTIIELPGKYFYNYDNGSCV
jgi:hypothetical protein